MLSHSSISPSICMLSYSFFFQAEDGIRVHCVTGVQTCALPIWKFAHQKQINRFGKREAAHHLVDGVAADENLVRGDRRERRAPAVLDGGARMRAPILDRKSVV